MTGPVHQGLPVFLTYYVLAVVIAVLGMGWAVVSGIIIWPAFYGVPLEPDPYSGVSVLMEGREALHGLPSDSFLASLSMAGEHWFLLPMYMFPMAPSIAALIMVGRHGGWPGVKDLLAKFKPVQPGVSGAYAAKLYGLIFVFIGFSLMAFLAMAELSKPGSFAVGVDNLALDTPFFAMGFLLLGIMTSHGAAFEELGWRGYAWPMLQNYLRTPLHAAIFLGVFWAAWHLPREVVIIAGGGDPVPILINQVAFFLHCVCSSIVMGYAVNLARGGVIPAIMIHGALNVVPGSIPHDPFFLAFSVNTLMWVGLAVTIVAIAGTRLGRQDDGLPDRPLAA